MYEKEPAADAGTLTSFTSVCVWYQLLQWVPYYTFLGLYIGD